MGAIGNAPKTSENLREEQEIISEIFNIYSEKKRERAKVCGEQNNCAFPFQFTGKPNPNRVTERVPRFRRRLVVVVVFSLVVKHQNYCKRAEGETEINNSSNRNNKKQLIHMYYIYYIYCKC